MIEKIILKKSAVLDKMPTTEQLEYGEIALNYNAAHPFLSFKDSDGDIMPLNDHSQDIAYLYSHKLDAGVLDAINENTDAIKKKLNISDFNAFKADNTKTINVLDRNVSQNSSEIQEVNGVVQNHTDAIATLNTSIAQKADKTDIDTINAKVDKKVSKTDITQSTGTSETAVMSQKAVSDALSNVYTKSESDARYLRGEVLYEDYYYPNMGETTDKVNFTDSTQILQPTKFIESYIDADGTTWSNVFECESFPDWFEFSDKACYPYGNGNSVGYLFLHNFVVENDELVYDFYTLQNNNIGQKLPYYADKNGLGLKKIDATHFKVYTTKNGTTEFTAMNKANVDCSLFAFSPLTYNPIYDIDECKLVRITLTGNIQSPSRYSSLLQGSCDVGLFGHTNRQVLYGDEYVEIEIDKNNNRWRQVKSGYSMFYRSGYSQNWSANKPESYESECRCLWSNIPNGTVAKICMINNKVCYAFAHWSNPLTILRMGCKIKIEKLA